MGVYLSKANTTKVKSGRRYRRERSLFQESQDGGDAETHVTRYGVSAMQGWRQQMEDAHIAMPLVEQVANQLKCEVSLYGVFDGHGGHTVSEWIARHVGTVLSSSVQTAQASLEKTPPGGTLDIPSEVAVLCEALQKAFLRLDVEMQTDENRDEIKEIFQARPKSDETDHSDEGLQPYRSLLGMGGNPRTLLQALLSGSGNRPTIRMVEQNGEHYFQITPPDEELEEEHPRGGSPEVSSLAAPVPEGTKPPATKADSPRSKMEIDADSPVLPAKADIIAEEVPQAISTVPLVDIIDGDDADVSNDEGAVNAASMITRANLPAWGPENCGAAAIVAAVVGGDKPFLVTANAGDSRCVLCRNGRAIGMSQDHKPQLPGEFERIRKAGGSVLSGRVDGNLNLSRTIGDLFYKTNTELSAEQQKITAFPDVRVIELTQEDEFVILACDGIWDCVTNEDAVQFVRQRLGENPDQTKLSKICEELCDFCLADNPADSDGGIGCDNMTCIIVLISQRVRKNAAETAGDLKMYESPFNNQASSNVDEDGQQLESKVADSQA